MNNKLSVLQEDGDIFTSSYSSDQIKRKCAVAADKRTQSRAVIAKARADVTTAMSNFVRGAEKRYGTHAADIRTGLESGLAEVSGKWQKMFDLLDRDAKAHAKVYEFLATEEFFSGKPAWRSAADKQREYDLSTAADKAERDLDEFRKKVLDDMSSSAQRFSQ